MKEESLINDSKALILSWKADRDSSKPIYIQLSEYIIALIDEGSLPLDGKLPSERLIADGLNISKHTISAAMVYLQEHGYIKRFERKGTFIAGGSGVKTGRSSLQIKWLNLLNKGLQDVPNRCASNLDESFLHLTKRHSYGDNFAKFLFSNTDLSTLNVKDIRYDGTVDLYGIYPLRQSICEYMKSFGVNAKPEQILLFSSVTQVSAVLARLFLNPGIDFYYEKYSYINLKNVMSASGANFRQLEMDSEGIVIDRLKKFVRPPKNLFLHIHPCNHNPTGVTASLRRRQEIIEYCSNRGVPIVEVDSMRGIYLNEKEPPPLKALDNDSVIFVGNFLHPTSEMLGLAWICADEKLINKIQQLKLPMDSNPSLIMQIMMDNALRSGLFHKYLFVFRDYLAGQLKALDEVMKHYLSDVAVWNNSRSSYFLWPEFEKGIDTKILYEHRGNLGFNPGYFYNSSDRSHLSIVTLSMDKGDFPRAIERLRRLIDMNRKY